MGNLRRVHPVCTGEFVDRFQSFERFEATRALNSALYCFRWVDLAPLLLSYGHSILSSLPVQFSGYIILLFHITAGRMKDRLEREAQTR